MSHRRSKSKSYDRTQRKSKSPSANFPSVARNEATGVWTRPPESIIKSTTVAVLGLSPLVNDITLSKALPGPAAFVCALQLSKALESFNPVSVRSGVGQSQAIFADFSTHEEAFRLCRAGLVVDGASAKLEMVRGSFGNRGLDRKPHWDCFQCGGKNYLDREICYRCPASKEASIRSMMKQRDCLSILESTMPTNVLLLRNLSIHTNETKIAEKLRDFAPVMSLRLFKDSQSGVSRGTAAAEFRSVEHATHTLNTASRNKLLIDNLEPVITYAKAGYGPVGSQGIITAAAVEAAALNAVNIEAKNRETERYGNSSYNEEKLKAAGSGGFVPAIFAAAAMKARAAAEASANQNSEAELAAAVAKAKAKKEVKQSWPPTFEKAGAAYVFDPNSTYFYESASGAYYDPKTKFYFISGAWFQSFPGNDPPFKEAVTAEVTTTSEVVAEVKIEKIKEESKIDPIKKQKLSFGLKAKAHVAQAPRIAVDSSSSESEKEMPKIPTKVKRAVVPPPKKFEMAEIQFKEMEAQAKVELALQQADALLAKSSFNEEKRIVQPASAQGVGGVPEHACMLCLRGFKSAGMLAKHKLKSKLHAENLAKLGPG
eukprot:CAMPEP_0171467186 /NCGR_PEP_ID=MMETSP0945-20130129/9784_1 /TAXON_ID=109269 /ORGANISM="Vaucheria litorea, Strain CCMP2940" /LENGTH=598 /DNA_ID=CAMNT_0011995581 /DNA_START=151 /DNA_END=1948 /DNA_ORIENTATION=+